MKSFYSEGTLSSTVPVESGSYSAAPATRPTVPSAARIAVYDAPGAAPRVEEVPPAPINEFIEAITTRVHHLTREAGGNLPYTVVREVAENFIHADFADPVVSILDGGATVRFADQGPGIVQKDRAVLPGYTTARGHMKAHIRGVGSGLPIVSDFLVLSGGALAIEDNLGCGSVVTISSRPAAALPAGSYNRLEPRNGIPRAEGSAVSAPSRPRLTTRQTQVLALVLESGSAGPSLVSKELSVGLSTAYRDLALLEELGLIESLGGKRRVTDQGLFFLDELTTR